ncbi:TPA: hypothetical protein ACK3RT_005453, partial [Burkholderia cepacia]
MTTIFIAKSPDERVFLERVRHVTRAASDENGHDRRIAWRNCGRIMSYPSVPRIVDRTGPCRPL